MAAPRAALADDVFINCPFDSKYAATFRALTFCIHACGFRPRSARELDDGGQMRMEKLFGIIDECRYGIHDLSRTELDEEHGLPRFNMPLELGIFLGAKRYGSARHGRKHLLVFDIDARRYAKFISDLAGMDIHAHGGEPVRAVRETRDWLANVSRRVLPSGAKVVRLYERFLADLPAICAGLEFELRAIPYIDLEHIVVNWLLEAPAAN